jgi:hypothetical protein
MTPREREAYKQGFEDGLSCYAWWKDGVQYVGSTGTTLAEARKLMSESKLWNQLKEMEDLKFHESGLLGEGK